MPEDTCTGIALKSWLQLPPFGVVDAASIRVDFFYAGLSPVNRRNGYSIPATGGKLTKVILWKAHIK